MIINKTSILARHIARCQLRWHGKYDPIKIIERCLIHSSGDNEVADLLTMKISFLRDAGRIEDIYMCIVKYIKLFPLIPEPWIQLAKFYRYDLEDDKKSLNSSDIAISIAFIDGNFIVHSLTEKVRVSLFFKRISDAEDSIYKLIEHKPRCNSIDTNYDTDFLRYPEASLLSIKCVDNYRDFLSKYKRDKRL